MYRIQIYIKFNSQYKACSLRIYVYQLSHLDSLFNSKWILKILQNARLILAAISQETWKIQCFRRKKLFIEVLFVFSGLYTGLWLWEVLKNLKRVRNNFLKRSTLGMARSRRCLSKINKFKKFSENLKILGNTE